MKRICWVIGSILSHLIIFNHHEIAATSPQPENENFNSSARNISTINAIEIRKCCPLGQIIHKTVSDISCEVSTFHPWIPVLYAKPEEKLDPNNYYVSFFVSEYGIPSCKHRALDNQKDIWFNILHDGSVVVGLNFWTIPVWLRPGKDYCVDAMSNDVELDYNETSDRNSILIFCELEDFDFYLFLRIGFGTLFTVSAVSLFLTIVIYLLIWDYHTTHGWTQFSFFLSLFLYFTSEGSRIFTKYNGLEIEPTRFCFVHAIIAQYSILVITGTGSMMSIDCFVTFWKLRSVRSKTRRELVLYVFISWVIPLVAVILGIYFHYRKNPAQRQLEFSGIFQYAHYRCSSPIWEFAYPVQLALLLINVLAFVGTGYLIIRHFKSTAFARANRKDSVKCKIQFKKSLRLFLKLFSMLGVSWILNAIDLLLGYKDPMGWPFILVRVYLSLQGIIYLVIFGLHRKNFVQLTRKYPTLQRFWLFSNFVKGNINLSNPQNSASTTPSANTSVIRVG